jgi:hypothetical protein
VAERQGLSVTKGRSCLQLHAQADRHPKTLYYSGGMWELMPSFKGDPVMAYVVVLLVALLERTVYVGQDRRHESSSLSVTEEWR